jgi:Fe-S cluster assembly ATP-binding protein
VREKAKALKIDAEMLKRPVNVGFSGGEKKRNEILQMAMLEPGCASWTRPTRALTSTR